MFCVLKERGIKLKVKKIKTIKRFFILVLSMSLMIPAIVNADNLGIVAEETITDTNMLSPDSEDQTGKDEFQQEEDSLTENDPAEESIGTSKHNHSSLCTYDFHVIVCIYPLLR